MAMQPNPTPVPSQTPTPTPAQGAGPSATPAQAGQQDLGNVQNLITGINTSMLKLKEVMMNAGSIPQPEIQKLDGLIKGYQGFIIDLSKTLQGGSAGAPQGAPSANPAPKALAKSAPKKGPVPATGGPNGVPAM